MTDDIATPRRIPRTCHTMAIVGLSADWHRPSNFVGNACNACNSTATASRR
jgi:hypothetical protein